MGAVQGFQFFNLRRTHQLLPRKQGQSTALRYSPLSLDNSLTTVITLYPTVDSKHQNTILSILEKSLLPNAKEQKGFTSAHIHSSLDGLKVATYEQWATLNDYHIALEHIMDGEEMSAIMSRADCHIYEIVASQSNLKPTSGQVAVDEKYPLVHFAEFRVRPENQPKMIELAKQNLGPAMETEGLLTATFHKSTDGMRVVNYGQWENAEAIEKLKNQPGFGTGTPYWEGIAENEHHLYMLVSSHEKGSSN